jgi:hypothetical protein
MAMNMNTYEQCLAFGVDLRTSLVVRVLFGLQGLHGRLAQSIKTMVLSECKVHPSVRSL